MTAAIASTPRSQQLGPEHLVERLQPLLVLDEAQQPRREARVVLVLLVRDAQELRRRVDDDRADRAIEHPQAQAVEQDAGPARVVDEDVAVAQVLRELRDARVEVVIPAVLVDVVVRQARPR